MQYVIIGSGVAGVAAAEAIRSVDSQGKILLLGEELEGYYSRPGLAYYLTGELGEDQLCPYRQKDFEKLDLTIKTVHVRAIRPADHRLLLESGVSTSYDRLLIATGAGAAMMKAPGMHLEGVVKLDCLADARRILRLARKARSAVVIGGGITALELVEGLVARRVKTHYFLRGDRYWSSVLDETESRIVERRLKEEGVQIHYRTELEAVLERKGRVAGVVTRDGRRIACEMVAIAIGVAPRKALAESAGLRTDRGILVDETLRTSDPFIYAAGDVAQVYDPLTGVPVLDSLWGPAREQGWVAGLNMAGREKRYLKKAPFNVTRLANLTTTIIGTVGHGRDDDLLGIARGDSETWRHLPDVIAAQGGFEVNRLRVLVGQKTLVGAIVMGDQTLSQPLQRLIADQVDITWARSKLLEPGAAVANLVVEIWNRYNERGHHGT